MDRKLSNGLVQQQDQESGRYLVWAVNLIGVSIVSMSAAAPTLHVIRAVPKATLLRFLPELTGLLPASQLCDESICHGNKKPGNWPTRSTNRVGVASLGTRLIWPLGES